MIPIALPKPRLILRHDILDAPQPFGAFPEIEMRHYHPDRISMLRGQKFAVMFNAKKTGFSQKSPREGW